MVSDSWIRGLWRAPRKHESGPEKAVIGVLAFEVASLMCKLVNLWQSLSDKQIARLREDIMDSEGIKKLVSDDDEYIVGLICAEIIENMGHVARAVARLGKKCNDPGLNSFEHVFTDLIKNGADLNGWEFSLKKMERKIKKMDRLILMNANLYQEMDMLTELEQTLKRMGANDDTESLNLVEFEKKVARKKQEVKKLKEISLWNRTYDYTVRLLARSLFTIFSRIKNVFGINQMVDKGGIDYSTAINSDYIHRSQSVSVLMQSSVHPSENGLSRFSSGPMVKSITRSGPISRTMRTSNFYSGPLGSSTEKSNPTSGMKGATHFYSGPLGKPGTKSGPLSGTSKSIRRLWQKRYNPSIFPGKNSHPKHNHLAPVGPFKGRVKAGNNSPFSNCYSSSNGIHSGNDGSKNAEGLADLDILHANLSIFSPKRRLLEAPPETLGGSALALHYANVIIVIEKLVASPHLIGHDARDDLYNMLPTRVRAALREKLKPYAKSLASSVYDTTLAAEWSGAMAGILEWLAPLAHNMIRWQSERSMEQQNFVSRTYVLLVQTLYFANQEKTEATITELLVGLNYIWRFGRELNAKAILECASSKVFDEYLDLEG